MSGIVALLQRSSAGGTTAQANELLTAMLSRLAHRGAADSLHHVPGVGGLGRRSSPTEQVGFPRCAPHESAEGHRLVVADARIDNAATLRAQLDLAKSANDGEVILAAYERWGTQCASHLLGDFAFVILDVPRKRLYCARDPLGIRPLYWCEHGGVWRCASEVQALFADPSLPTRANLEQLALFIELEHTENQGTLWSGIAALPPAHQLTVAQQTVRQERYWRPNPWQRLGGLSDEQYASLLHDAISEAVRCRLPAAGRVGVYLSGGLDSCSVIAEVERLRREGHGSKQPPVALHATFDGSPDDETRYSDAVADMWGLPRINAPVLTDASCTPPKPMVGHPDVMYDPRLAMWGSLSAGAHEHGVQLVMTGEGVDLCLRPTGLEMADALRQGRFAEVLRASKIFEEPRSARAWGSLWSGAVRPALPGWAQPASRLARWPLRTARRALGRGQGCELLAPRHARQVEEHRRARSRARAKRRFPDLVTRELCCHLEESAYPAMLANAERFVADSGMLMSHPTADLRVIDLLLSMPHEQRHVVGLIKPKPVLRRAMAELLPDVVRHRRDAGRYERFMRQVMFGTHGEATHKLFASSRLLEAGLLTRQTARELAQVQVTPSGGVTSRSAMALKNIVALEIWLRQL